MRTHDNVTCILCKLCYAIPVVRNSYVFLISQIKKKFVQIYSRCFKDLFSYGIS